MKLGEKLFKWVSYGFMLFIVILIVFTFGMPEFLGSSADAKRFIAAEVGKEVITRKEVQNMKEYLMRQPQFQAFASQDAFVSKYALDYLVTEKLQVIINKESGLYPLSDAKSTLIARYLRENFKEFQTNEGFDFARFEKDFLKPRHITFAAIEDQAVRTQLYEIRQMLDGFDVVSDREIQDQYALKNTKISYQILVFTPDEKKNALKKIIGITEQDILERFKKDYLSKDKNDKLTDLKKEAITQSIINEKRAKAEKDWMSAMSADMQKSSLQQLNQKFGGLLVTVNNVGISESIAQAAKNNKANLNLLESDSNFLEALSGDKVGKTQGPWNISDNLFLVQIVSITKPEEAKPADLIAFKDQVNNENKNAASHLMDETARGLTKISRFSQGEE